MYIVHILPRIFTLSAIIHRTTIANSHFLTKSNKKEHSPLFTLFPTKKKMTSNIKMRQKQMPPNFINNKCHKQLSDQRSASRNRNISKHTIYILYICGVKCFALRYIPIHCLFIYFSLDTRVLLNIYSFQN